MATLFRLRFVLVLSLAAGVAFLSGRWSALSTHIAESHARSLGPDSEVGPKTSEFLASSSEPPVASGQGRQVGFPTDSVVVTSAPAQPTSVREALVGLRDIMIGQLVFSGTDQDIAAKYAGVEPTQLALTLMILQPLRDQEGQRVTNEQIRRGNYTQHFIPEGEKHRFPKSKGTELVTIGFSSTDVGGGTEMKTTELPESEFPEFNALSKEVWWIQRRLKQAGISPCAPF